MCTAKYHEVCVDTIILVFGSSKLIKAGQSCGEDFGAKSLQFCQWLNAKKIWFRLLV